MNDKPGGRPDQPPENAEADDVWPCRIRAAPGAHFVRHLRGCAARRLRENQFHSGTHSVWPEVIPFFAFPTDVRKLIYTTNAIEALNSKLRRAVRARGHFPTDEAALKLLFLVLNRAEKEWIMPPREWNLAKAQFAVLFGERFKRAAA
jgi:hypothetical protein